MKTTENNLSEINREAYRNDDAVEKYSTYGLYEIEKYIVNKYFKQNDKILDLGCGGGRTTIPLYEMGYNVKGVDLSDVLINLAKRRFPYIDFEIGDYCSLKEDSNNYDIVFLSHNGLDYAYPYQKRLEAISETYRILKNDGLFIFSSHNIRSLLLSPYYLKSFSRILWKLKNTAFGVKNHGYIKDLGMCTYYGSPKWIVSELSKNGFEMVEVIGFRMINNVACNSILSPYVHYICRKK